MLLFLGPRLQVSHENLAKHSADVDRELDAAQTDLDRQRKLNEKLETDLLSIHNRAGAAGPASATEGYDVGGAAGDKGKGGLAGLAIGGKGKEVEGAKVVAGASQQDNSILPIVTSQRDRFRARNAELEEVCLSPSLSTVFFWLNY